MLGIIMQLDILAKDSWDIKIAEISSNNNLLLKKWKNMINNK